MTRVVENLVKLPPLVAESGSLTPMEKSLLAHFILLARPRIIVELGVYKARTTVFMCGVIEANALDCTVYGFDMPDMVAELRAENADVQALEASGRLRLIPGMLPESLDAWLKQNNQPINLALVDAKHDFWSVNGELRRLWTRLAPDGFILCHDYSPKYDGVRYGVDQFAARHGAMVLPLNSSPAATESGFASVLVALTKPRAQYSLNTRLRHHGRALRAQLKRNPVISQLWRVARRRK